MAAVPPDMHSVVWCWVVWCWVVWYWVVWRWVVWCWVVWRWAGGGGHRRPRFGHASPRLLIGGCAQGFTQQGNILRPTVDGQFE